MDKRARNELFLARLGAAPICGSVEAALDQIAAVLNGVENEFTSITFNPATWNSDGRMYPPQEDQRREVTDHTEIRRYRSVGHNIWVAENGAIMIELVKGASICLDKPGSNGLTIGQMMGRLASMSSSTTSLE